LVLHEVTPDLAAAKTDLDPMLFILLGFFEAGGGRWVKRMNLQALLHVLGALLGQDPGIGTACIEDCPHLLRLARADIQLTDVRQILRIGERLFHLHV